MPVFHHHVTDSNLRRQILRHYNHRHRLARCLGIYETLLEIAKKKALIFELFKCFILHLHGKKLKYLN